MQLASADDLQPKSSKRLKTHHVLEQLETVATAAALIKQLRNPDLSESERRALASALRKTVVQDLGEARLKVVASELADAAGRSAVQWMEPSSTPGSFIPKNPAWKYYDTLRDSRASHARLFAGHSYVLPDLGQLLTSTIDLPTDPANATPENFDPVIARIGVLHSLAVLLRIPRWLPAWLAAESVFKTAFATWRDDHVLKGPNKALALKQAAEPRQQPVSVRVVVPAGTSGYPLRQSGAGRSDGNEQSGGPTDLGIHLDTQRTYPEAQLARSRDRSSSRRPEPPNSQVHAGAFAAGSSRHQPRGRSGRLQDQGSRHREKAGMGGATDLRNPQAGSAYTSCQACGAAAPRSSQNPYCVRCR